MINKNANAEIPERIREIRKRFFNDSNLAFSEFMGEKTATTSGWISGRRNIGRSVIDKILDKLPDVSPTWLLTGSGEMLSTSPQTQTTKNEAVPFEFGSIMNVPLVNQYAYAGYLCGYSDPEYIGALPTIPFPVDREYKGQYICFEVKGDSMDDGSKYSFDQGDIVLCREISRDYWKTKLHIKQWNAFVIVHQTEGILIKQIIDHDVENGIITIHSLNPLYEDRQIHLSEVKMLFNVVKMQRNQ